jgi:hypothetical protein
MKTYQLAIHACVGVYRVQGGGVSARSRKCGEVGALDLGWLGTICRQNCVYYNYVQNGIHNNTS